MCILVAALALTDHVVEAHEALQTLPRALHRAVQDDRGMEGAPGVHGSQRWRRSALREMNERTYDGLRKAGMPEQ